MTDLAANPAAALDLNRPAFTTETLVSADVMNAELQQLLDNDGALKALYDALLATVNGAASGGQIGNLQSQINALTLALSGKASVSHSHGMSEIIGLLDELSALKARVRYVEQNGGTGSTPPTSAGVITADFTSAARAADNRIFDFSATATSASGSGINSYQWSFGDGTTGTGQNVTHTFTGSGVFHLSLRVTAVDGGISNTQRDITVAGPEALPPNGYGLTDSFTSRGGTPVNLTFSDLNFGGGATPVTTRLSFNLITYDATYTYNYVMSVYVNGVLLDRANNVNFNLTNTAFGLNTFTIPNYTGQAIQLSLYSAPNGYDGEPTIQRVRMDDIKLHFTY